MTMRADERQTFIDSRDKQHDNEHDNQRDGSEHDDTDNSTNQCNERHT